MIKKKVLALIPTRLNSRRLPAKALLPINNIPLIMHVYNRALLSKNIDDVLICCDDKKIFNDKPKHLILCIKDCHFYTSDEERKSWNDFFLPRHFLEKKIIYIDNNNMSLFLIERRYN